VDWLVGHEAHHTGDLRWVGLDLDVSPAAAGDVGIRHSPGIVRYSSRLVAMCSDSRFSRGLAVEGQNGAVRIPSPHRLRELYREHIASNPRRERLFLSSVSFFAAFGTTRAVTHAIRDQIGPFHNLGIGGKHIHHLVFGITGLLVSGYLWLLQVGTGHGGDDAISRVTSVLYGAGSALTLDEFALWLNLEDVYWAKQGRESVDAVVLFGALLSMGIWGGPFFKGVIDEIGRV
jgi:hypothetical protein